jgi:hypothetical protein
MLDEIYSGVWKEIYACLPAFLPFFLPSCLPACLPVHLTLALLHLTRPRAQVTRYRWRKMWMQPIL